MNDSPSKYDSIKFFDPHIPDLVEVVLAGFASLMEHARKRPEVHPHLHVRTRASYVYDEIWRHAIARFNGTNVQFEFVGDVNFLAFDLTVWVRFKKLGQDGRPRNYPTNQAKAFCNDPLQVEMFPGTRNGVTPTVFVVGYQLDPSGTEIARILVVKMCGSAVEWKHTLYDQTEGLVHELPVEEKPKPVVLPKKDEEKDVEER